MLYTTPHAYSAYVNIHNYPILHRKNNPSQTINLFIVTKHKGNNIFLNDVIIYYFGLKQPAILCNLD